MADIKKSILKIIKSFTQEIMDNEPNKDSYLDEYFIALNDLYENAQAHLQTFNTIVDGIEDDPSKAAASSSYFVVTRLLERIGDHIVNLASWVVYKTTGELEELTNATENQTL